MEHGIMSEKKEFYHEGTEEFEDQIIILWSFVVKYF
jgi:hypothetical protein